MKYILLILNKIALSYQHDNQYKLLEENIHVLALGRYNINLFKRWYNIYIFKM